MIVETYNNGVLVSSVTVPDNITVDNRDALVAKATTALANNATYLAITSPTNAQVVAQVKALTRQVNALIRLTLNELDSIADS